MESSVVRLRYKQLQGTFSPIVRLLLFHNKALTWVDAYVDSGAMYSIFDETVAEELGIVLKDGRMIPVASLSGEIIPIYLHPVGIRVEQINIRSTVGFSNRLGVGFNLLGRYSIFNQLQFCFNDRDHELSVSPL